MKRSEHQAPMGKEGTSAKRNQTMQAQIDELRASQAASDSNTAAVLDFLVAGVTANRLIATQLIAQNLAIMIAGGPADAKIELSRFHQSCLGPVNIVFAANGEEAVQKLCKMTAGKIDEFFAEVVAAAEIINAAKDADSADSKH